MRYLYGDSAPFPYAFDFLATLERFLEESVKVVRKNSEMEALVKSAEAVVTVREEAYSGLESFHGVVSNVIDQGAKQLGGELAPEYANRVLDAARRALDDAKRAATARTDVEGNALQHELDRRRGEIYAALESFIVLGRLPVLAATIRMELIEARAQMRAELVHPEGIAVGLALAADRHPDWQSPRRAGEFVPNLEMIIGLKRGLFRGERLEPVRLDDFIVGGFVLAEDTAVLRLRKRASDPDQYVLSARLEGGNLVAEVTRPLESGDRALPTAVEEGDRRQVLQLWERIRGAVEGPLDRRERMTALYLDGQDVIEGLRSGAFVERLVKSFAHTVTEIARRSPNKEELSLKREDDRGNREELYVKKRDLAARLAGLSPAELAVFAPLNLA